MIRSFAFLCCLCLVVPAQAEEKKLDPDIETQVKLLKSAKTSEKLSALENLAKKGTDAAPALPDICSLLLRESNSKVKAAAMDAVEKISPNLHPLVETLLLGGKKDEALQKLIDLGDEGKLLLPLVAADFKAATDKKKFPGSALTQAMVALDPSPNTLKALTTMISDWPGDGPVLRFLIPLVGKLGKEEKCRKQALQTLVTCSKPNDKLTTSTGQEIRLVGVKELTAFGEDALPSLKQLKLDGDEKIRQAAKEAIEKIEKK